MLRDYGLRVAVEQESLSWSDIAVTKVSDPSSEFNGQRMVILVNLLYKGENLSLKIPKKSKDTFKPDQVENLNDPLCIVSMTHAHRDMCSHMHRH